MLNESKNTPTLPVINLPSGPVTMRRLGIQDAFSVLALMRAGYGSWLEQRGASLNPPALGSPEAGLSLMFHSLPTLEDQLLPWLGSLVGLTPEETIDPERLPLALLPDLVAGAVSHPDFQGFRTAVQRIFERVAARLKPVEAQR